MNHVCLNVDGSVALIKELDRLTDERAKIVDRQNAISNHLKKIARKTLLIQEWKNEVQHLMRFNFLIEFTGLSFMICLCIYTIMTNFFGAMSPFAILTVFLSRLFMYCLLGSRLDTKIETLTAALYDTEWYKMNIGQQKQLQVMIMKSQSIKGFNGIFQQVSLETFQKVQKNINTFGLKSFLF